MSEMFTKCNGFIVSGDPLVYADSATMTGQGTVSEPFGVKSTDLFVKEPLYTGVSGNSAYIGWRPDETVLWSGTATSGDITLSETYKNFEKIGIVHGCTYSYNNRGVAPDSIFDVDTFQLYNCGQIITTDMTIENITPPTGTNTIYTTYTQFSAVNDTKLHFAPSQVVFNTVPYNTNNATITGKWAYENSRRYFKIYGINRKV